MCPRLANYKTFATVYLFLKSDKKMTENEARKDDQVNSRNDRIWKKKKGGGGRTRTEVLMASMPLILFSLGRKKELTMLEQWA